MVIFFTLFNLISHSVIEEDSPDEKNFSPSRMKEGSLPYPPTPN